MNGAHRRQRRRYAGGPDLLDRNWWIELSNQPWMKIVAVVGGAFVIGYLLTAILFFPGHGSGVVTVPDLRGLSEEEAREELDGSGLEFEDAGSLVHPQVPEGAVLAQSPLPGEEVAPGTSIRVHVSAGRARREIPDVRRLPAGRAQMLLSRNGFEVLFDTVADTLREGSVVDVQPAPGTTVELPAEIRLVISSGPPMVAVPDVLALPPTDAAEVLEQFGLELGQIDYDPFSSAPLGEVVEQQPLAGDSLRQGSTVDVVVSGGQPLPEIIRPSDIGRRRGRSDPIIRDIPSGY